MGFYDRWVIALVVPILTAGLIVSGLRLQAHMEAGYRGNGNLAVRIAPFDWRLLFLKSNALMNAGRCEDAVKTFGKLLSIYPHYWAAKNNLAICLAILGDPTRAEMLWKEILSDWPYHDEAKKNLAELRRE